jgi:hypothetical protein
MYHITLRVTDALGNTTLLQLIAVVNGKTPMAGVISSGGGTGLLTTVKNWLWLAWPAYGIFVLMVLSFWLGEREELRVLLRAQPRISHRRR